MEFKMADGSLFNEIVLDEKLVELWPDYSYHVRSPDFKYRISRIWRRHLRMFMSCFVIKGATIARIVSENSLSNR